MVKRSRLGQGLDQQGLKYHPLKHGTVSHRNPRLQRLNINQPKHSYDIITLVIR